MAQNRGFDKAIADFDKALELDSNDATAYALRARFRSSCPVGQYRNGQLAIEDAERACALTEWKDPLTLSELAAAYAENGDFESAIRWQEEAIHIAPEWRKEDWKSRLDLFRSHRPYRTNMP